MYTVYFHLFQCFSNTKYKFTLVISNILYIINEVEFSELLDI